MTKIWSRLGRLWPLAPVALVGAAVGVVGWGGMNMAMEATNSLEFCTSCHVMRNNVFQEYKKTIHYSNRSGVRATCSDCHVPRDWTHKVVRKIASAKELYHWALGSIDTREKFEAKRHELARSEWDRMRANDSRECRNCHSFEAMDFHKQNAKAATAMRQAAKAGKTCIDCHKGIAHPMPDVTAGHRAAFAALEAAAATTRPAAGATVYAIGTVPFRIEGETKSAGELAAAARATVIGAASDRLDLELTGWRREGTPATLYQRRGARIVMATLSDAAAGRLEPLETVTDDDSGYQWTRVRLRVAAAPGRFVAALDRLWTIGAQINEDNCALCHVLMQPQSTSADAWIGHVNAMARYTPLNGEEVKLLRSYLQNHARK